MIFKKQKRETEGLIECDYLAIFRHIRGVERNINCIFNMLFPERKTLPLASCEAFENNQNKRTELVSYAVGVDYLVESLLNSIKEKGCDYVGNNREGSNDDGNN